VSLEPSEDRDWHTEEILMTVKAYPNPQEDFGEAACTAGMTGDGRWLRVNPVPFRQLRKEQQFEKWTWIRASVRPGGDNRPESHVVQPESIQVVRKVGTGTNGDWATRNASIAPFMVDSVDALKRDADQGRRTMAYLRPLEIRRFIIEPRKANEVAWNEKQAAQLGRQTLFGPSVDPLERIPYRFYYEFVCQDASCTTVHRMQVLDWEIHQSYRKWFVEYGADGWEAALRNRYEHEFLNERDLVFNLGNIAAHQQSFCICAMHYPPRLEVENLQLPMGA
jgi:hypothetical protein